MVERFCILGLPRSGTNYLMSKIAPLPGVLAAWEPFNVRMDQWFDQTDTFRSLPDLTKNILTNKNQRNLNPEEFFSTVFSSESEIYLPGVKAIGFKMFPQHNYEIFWNLTRNRSLKVIVAERTNRLESFVSYITAMSTDRWVGSNDDYRGRVLFDPYFFETYCAFVETTYAGIDMNLTSHGVTHIKLKYDQVVGEEISFLEVCDFLKIGYITIKSALKKQINFNAVDIFSNKVEAERYIKSKYPEYISSLR